MTARTSKKTVTFERSFELGGFDEVLPAGAYVVETEETPLEGISFLAYRRVSTRIYLNAKSGSTRVLTIDPNDLNAALMRDRAPAQLPADADDGHTA